VVARKSRTRNKKPFFPYPQISQIARITQTEENNPKTFHHEGTKTRKKRFESTADFADHFAMSFLCAFVPLWFKGPLNSYPDFQLGAIFPLLAPSAATRRSV
jgi:hypothetical protein